MTTLEVSMETKPAANFEQVHNMEEITPVDMMQEVLKVHGMQK